MENNGGMVTYKEIYGQTESFESVMDSLPEILQTLKEVFQQKYDEIIFTGCGTSLYLAQTAAYLFSQYNDVQAKAVCCSELYNTPEVYVKGDNTLVLPITRKSYTTEVRMAIDRVRQLKGVKSCAITCDKDSEIYNDYYVWAKETQEDSVIMTRSFTAMLLLVEIVSLYAANKMSEIDELKDLPTFSKELIPEMDKLAEKIVKENPNIDLIVTLGQGAFYGVANECMNKMKEMSLMNSEAYYSLEYRHGPMSLVTSDTLIINLSDPKTAESENVLMKQMESYGAITLILGSNPELIGGKYMLKCGYDNLSSVVTATIISQFLGYHISQVKGINADSPRHLTQAIVLNDK